MGDPPKPDKGQLVDCVVLAFAHSQLAEAIESESVRNIVQVEIHDIVSNDAFDMQLVWELLEEQPGFTAEAATPAVCTFKTWEEKLGLEVLMPEALAELSEKDIKLAAGTIVVPAAELTVILRLHTGQTAKPSAPVADTNVSARHLRARKERPAWVGWLAMAVTVGTFAYTSLTLYKGCPRGGSGDWSEFSAKIVADELPLKDATKLGTQVQATLKDDNWKALPLKEKKRALKNALLLLEDQQVRVLIVKDSKGVIIGTAQKTRDDDVAVSMSP